MVKVSDIMGEISCASSEQSSGIAQISQAIAQLDNVTQKNAGMVSHAQQVSTSLQAQVGELAQAISIFQTASRLPAGSGTPRPPRLAARQPSATVARPRRPKTPVAEDSWEAF